MFPVRVRFRGCGHFLIYLNLWEAILVDLLPELFPPAFCDGERSKAQDDLRSLWGPAHARTTQALFDQRFARCLSNAGTDRDPVLKIAGIVHLM